MSIPLYLYGRKANNLFGLHGEQENDITVSLAFLLARIPNLLSSFLRIFACEAKEETVVRVQQYESSFGITDIEIEQLGDWYVIIEAKTGWDLPTKRQLERYISRQKFKQSPVRCVVIITNYDAEFVGHALGDSIGGVPLRAVSWKNVTHLVREASQHCVGWDRHLLKEFYLYLEGIMSKRSRDLNEVLVVALAKGAPVGWPISWIQIVRDKHRYFHPVGRRWPKEPLKYIGFRYHGKLQSVHHVDRFEIVNSEGLRSKIGIPKGHTRITEGPHFLYELGPVFLPSKEVRTGSGINRSAHAWCELDTLFTSDTISEARNKSMRRKKSHL